MSEQLAIMSEPKFGMRDMDAPAFWFSVSFGSELSSGALIILPIEEMAEAVRDAKVYDMSQLKDHPCQIETNEKGYVSFVKVLK